MDALPSCEIVFGVGEPLVCFYFVNFVEDEGVVGRLGKCDFCVCAWVFVTGNVVEEDVWLKFCRYFKNIEHTLIHGY